MKGTLALTLVAVAAAGCAAPPPPPLHTTVVMEPRTVICVPAGHGYLIGAHRNLLVDTVHNRQAAAAAIQRAQAAPATAADVHRSTTADLNHDGFVTADEVIALQLAGLGDMEIVRRLEATGHVFALTTPERDFLARHGVPHQVLDELQRWSIG
jgi:hypothetical protein